MEVGESEVGVAVPDSEAGEWAKESVSVEAERSLDGWDLVCTV